MQRELGALRDVSISIDRSKADLQRQLAGTAVESEDMKIQLRNLELERNIVLDNLQKEVFTSLSI